MKALTMKDVDMKGKRVVMRVDVNVPIHDGVITSDKRIRAVLPTIKAALEAGAGVILLAHLGRPTEGLFEEKFSLRPVAAHMGELLGQPVEFCADPLNGVECQPGQVVLCENVRFFKGEKKNNEELAATYAAMGDIYVMDAFGAAHRAQASTEGALRKAAVAVAGPLMFAEMEAASALLDEPKRPLYAIIGGSKVSTKLTVLDNLLNIVDGLIVGGGIANTFLEAAGYNMGASLVEKDLIPEAKRMIEKAKERGVALPLPTDVVVAPSFERAGEAVTKPVSELTAEDCAFDIGEATAAEYAKLLGEARTIVWNGPVGAFEVVPFDKGSRALADILAGCDAYTLVCGGDTVAAVESFGVADKMGYLSTGGGAFLEVLEGKTLPAVAALADCAK
ncbi:MAG: phosphoglycerate kinase [Mailhella sp.]|nr:phosphoglycerate kinase [Mailhella sp.]MBQ9104799.1 phosphoglycerate kinase [Mailhella sp.]